MFLSPSTLARTVQEWAVQKGIRAGRVVLSQCRGHHFGNSVCIEVVVRLVMSSWTLDSGVRVAGSLGQQCSAVISICQASAKHQTDNRLIAIRM